MTMGICRPSALKCGWADRLLKLKDVEVEERIIQSSQTVLK